MLVAISKIDVLAIGAHPDDVEVGAGGLVAKLSKMGLLIGVVDLSAGEMASNGTPEERRLEALNAGEHLNLAWRKCLGIPDRGIEVKEEYVLALTRVIREARPRLILSPYWDDRHPDHVNGSSLIRECHFNSGLRKFLPDVKPYRPSQLWYYFLSRAPEPKYIVDISEVYELKKQAISAYETQFGKGAGKTATYLNHGPGSLIDLIEARDRYFGSLIGVKYGEGFTTQGPLAIKNPLSILGGE